MDNVFRRNCCPRYGQQFVAPPVVIVPPVEIGIDDAEQPVEIAIDGLF